MEATPRGATQNQTQARQEVNLGLHATAAEPVPHLAQPHQSSASEVRDGFSLVWSCEQSSSPSVTCEAILIRPWRGCGRTPFNRRWDTGVSGAYTTRINDFPCATTSPIFDARTPAASRADISPAASSPATATSSPPAVCGSKSMVRLSCGTLSA
jgi:hypothetical protein